MNRKPTARIELTDSELSFLLDLVDARLQLAEQHRADTSFHAGLLDKIIKTIESTKSPSETQCGPERRAMSGQFQIGDRVRTKPGAAGWLQSKGWAPHVYPAPPDGSVGTVIGDHTRWENSYSHYECDFGMEHIACVHPDWLEPVVEIEHTEAKGE